MELDLLSNVNDVMFSFSPWPLSHRLWEGSAPREHMSGAFAADLRVGLEADKR